MTIMRKKIAEHMVLSARTSPHVYSVYEVDFHRLAQLREKKKGEYERNGTKLTYTALIAKVIVDALRAFPVVNASIDGENIVYKKDINLGIAVALDQGLIVPVIKNADEKNLVGLSRAIEDLAARARSKKLNPDEVQGGTFTITNPGIFGAVYGLPLINQPQVAILGVGGIEKRAVVVNDAIAIHPDLSPVARLRSPPDRRRGRGPVPLLHQGTAREIRRGVAVTVHGSRLEVRPSGRSPTRRRWISRSELVEAAQAGADSRPAPAARTSSRHHARRAQPQRALECPRNRGSARAARASRCSRPDAAATSPTTVPDSWSAIPIVELPPDRRDVHRYVRDLEEVLIRAVSDFGITAARIPGLTGIWVGDRQARGHRRAHLAVGHQPRLCAQRQHRPVPFRTDRSLRHRRQRA